MRRVSSGSCCFPCRIAKACEASARAQNLDPYLVAGLIRQESEFNPTVISHANAWGLMQLIPATGRMMANKQGISGFQNNMLLQPETSLQLGSTYLRTQIDKWNGNLEQTLAAYNAGPGRVVDWLAVRQYREPAEFVESIPFNETREYVQAVLRNAFIYRQLYDGKAALPSLLHAHVATPNAVISKSAAPLPVKRPVVAAIKTPAKHVTNRHTAASVRKKRKSTVS